MTRRIVVFLVMACCLAAAYPAAAQSERAHAWLGELDVLSDPATGPLERRAARVTALREQIARWLAVNPAIAVTLPPAAPWPDEEQLAGQIAGLKEAIDAIDRSDPGRPFYLGVTTVTVTAPAAALSPLSDSIDSAEIENHQALTVNQAIEYLPGVSVDHKGARNQTGISIGGFDSRQVPLYLDGVPAYVPFDGYVDLTRYLTSDIAQVQVAKGYSSSLLGPNVLGGAINVVTRQPQRRFEGDAFVGTAPGRQFNAGLHVGSRWRRFFVQGSADRLQSDFYPVSGSFASNAIQPTDRRVNSDRRDTRYRLRVAWTPGTRNQYVLSYSDQDGATGAPPSSGSAPACPSGGGAVSAPCVTPKFWRWPFWSSAGTYFNSTTALGGASSVQFRAFYIGYSNQLDMFDNATYSSMNLNASSGRVRNDDRSAGISGQLESHAVPRHTLAVSFFVKNDTHTEQTTTFSKANAGATTPMQTDRDRQSSFGVQDAIALSSALRATVGLSADHLNGLEAQDLSADKTQVVPFQVAGICSAAPGASGGCTGHLWAFNPVASLAYTSDRAGTLFVTFARKSRFPTMKDRYSYKAGKAIPNPALNAERANTWTAGASRAIGTRTVIQLDVYRSDVRDEIENVFFLSPLCPAGGKGGAGSCQQATNVGSELHDGVDLTVRTTVVPHVTVDANYGFLHREISGTTGLFPTGTPAHKLVATATARLPRSISALASVQHQSGVLTVSDNGLELPTATITTVDIGASLPIRRGVSVQGGIKNLLDANGYFWEGFPEPGRNGYITLRYAF